MYWARRLELAALTVALTAVFAAMSTIVLQAAAPLPRLVVSNAPKTVIARLDRPDLKGAAASAFLRWKQNDHLGAFYYALDGTWAYTHGYTDMRVARAHAEAQCRDHARAPCALYATLAPRGLHHFKGLVASSEIREQVDLYKTQDHFRAFAVSASGAWGRSWGYTSAADATAGALGQCATAEAEARRPTAMGRSCVVVRIVE